MAKPDSNAVRDYLAGQGDHLIELLRGLTEAESPSLVPAAQNDVRERLIDALEPLGYESRRVPGRSSGGMLYARPAGRKRRRPAQLMLGHYDTVWPLGTLQDMPFEVAGDIVRGPGVYDMKGGLCQAVLALEALALFPRRTSSHATALFQFRRRDREPRQPQVYRGAGPAGEAGIRAGGRRSDPGGKLKTTRKGNCALHHNGQGQGGPCGTRSRSGCQRHP